MSLVESAQREFECDFPDCKKHFDETEGARVAAIRNGDIVAFCQDHSWRLLDEDVNLRSLAVVRAEYNTLRKIPKEQPTAAQLRARQEWEYIASLKKP